MRAHVFGRLDLVHQEVGRGNVHVKEVLVVDPAQTELIRQ